MLKTCFNNLITLQFKHLYTLFKKVLKVYFRNTYMLDAFSLEKEVFYKMMRL